MNDNLSIFVAFGAGFMSFLSPCVLPLIPSWLCVIGGSPMNGDSEYKPKPVIRTASFVLGFSAVFMVFSIVFSAAFSLISGILQYINIAAGILVIILGLNIIFNFISFLNHEKRVNMNNKPKRLIDAFLLGGAFGIGWTPCIGPVLTGILVLAAQNGNIPNAALYLAFYSAGLGFPFILASFLFDAFVKFFDRIRRYMTVIQRISGVLLVVIGILIITGYYQSF